MTVANSPPIVPNAGHPPEGDLDGLLRAYFKVEMPDPWPSFEAPAPRNSVLPLRRPQPAVNSSRWRSRLALAASILLLIAGALLLGGSPDQADSPRRTLDGAPAVGDIADRPGHGTHIVVTPEGARLELHEFIPMK